MIVFKTKDVQVEYQYSSNPKAPDSDIIKLLTKHRRYNIAIEMNTMFQWDNVFDSNGDILKYITDEYFALPVYMLDHGGLTLSTTKFNDRWDSGKLGIICVSKIDAKKYVIPNFEEAAENYLKLYTNYLNGEIYSITISKLCPCCGNKIEDVNFYDNIVSEENLKELLENIAQDYDYTDPLNI